MRFPSWLLHDTMSHRDPAMHPSNSWGDVGDGARALVPDPVPDARTLIVANRDVVDTVCCSLL